MWYDDRPPGHQPPPTGCAEARGVAWRTGGRVIYGGGERRDDRWGRDERRDRECDEKDYRKGECDSDRDRDRGRGRERDDDRCIDRGHDGWCGYAEDRRGECVDRDRDGRCDYAEGRFPSTLPEMIWGVIFGRGERVDAVRRWVGAGDVRARVTDADRDRVPEVVTWVDARGRTLQRWIDDDRDGRADRVGIYRDGKVVRVIR